MMTRQTKGEHLHNDLKTRGCPVCNEVHRAVLDFFSQWGSAFVNDEEFQEDHAAVLGFCPFHTWQLETTISARGISAGYPKLLERVAGTLKDIRKASDNPAAELEKLMNNDRCSICNLKRSVEKAYIEQLAEFLQKKEGQDSYAHSQGVCLRHLTLLLASLTDGKITALVLNQAVLRFSEMAEDMRRYVLKRDALNRHLLTKDEKDAYIRALTHIAGSRWICFPR